MVIKVEIEVTLKIKMSLWNIDKIEVLIWYSENWKFYKFRQVLVTCKFFQVEQV